MTKLDFSGKEDRARPAPSAQDSAAAAEKRKAEHESQEETVSQPGGFNNDPDDPTNPNEAIERHRRKLRP